LAGYADAEGRRGFTFLLPTSRNQTHCATSTSWRTSRAASLTNAPSRLLNAAGDRSCRKVLDLVAAGRPIAQIANDLNISDQTIYGWRRQELIDTGSCPD